MYLPDVNVLLAAFRADHPEHGRCAAWLNNAFAQLPALAVSPQALSSVIRITTHKAYLSRPSTLDEALAFADAVLTHPKIVILYPGSQHWSLFEQLCRTANATGKLVPDAWFAALALEHTCTWVTLDKDFGKFPKLRWQLL